MKTFTLLSILALALVFLCLSEMCKMRQKESYANQVVHGQVGNIAGPILDPSYFVSDDKNRPLFKTEHLWAGPPRPTVV